VRLSRILLEVNQGQTDGSVMHGPVLSYITLAWCFSRINQMCSDASRLYSESENRTSAKGTIQSGILSFIPEVTQGSRFGVALFLPTILLRRDGLKCYDVSTRSIRGGDKLFKSSTFLQHENLESLDEFFYTFNKSTFTLYCTFHAHDALAFRESSIVIRS